MTHASDIQPGEATCTAGQNHLPPFAALRAFEAVFRVGGIRRAAADLCVSHAVISRHLKQVEAVLGVALVTREKNCLTLTPDGKAYHARISAALIELRLATSAIRGLRDERHLKVWSSPGLSAQWLAGAIAEFELTRPDTTVELKATDAPPDLLHYEADADIRYIRDWEAPANTRNVMQIELARPDIIPVASPTFLERSEPVCSLGVLAQSSLLHEQDESEWRNWLAVNRHVADHPLPGPLCWHAHLAIAAAKAGRGIALASNYLVRSDLLRGDLVEVRVPGSQGVPLGSYMFMAREDRWSDPRLASLRRFLRDQAIPSGPLPQPSFQGSRRQGAIRLIASDSTRPTSRTGEMR